MIRAVLDHDWVHPWRRPAARRRSVRLSAPREPLPDPVYDFEPLTTDGNIHCGWVPAHTDPLVFGQPGTTELQKAWMVDDEGYEGKCPCGVSWRGDGGCWACGRRP